MFPYYPLVHHFQNPLGIFENLLPFVHWNFGQDSKVFTSNHYALLLNHPTNLFFNQQSTIAKEQSPYHHENQPKRQTLRESQDHNYNDKVSVSDVGQSKDSQKSKKTKSILKLKEKESKRKNKSKKKDKGYVGKQYPKQQPSIKCRYIQKNFELNIINQVFSFLWSEEKSNKYVKRFYKDQVKSTLFYQYIKIVRKFCKRYINKEYLKNLCDYQDNHIAYKMVTKNSQKLQYLSIPQFSRCIRHLIFIYLHQLCPQAILTSKKMRREIWGEHLSKCRLLRKFMFQNLSALEYEKELVNGVNYSQKLNESTQEIGTSVRVQIPQDL